MSFAHALYYPHIHLTNKNWIKHSMLFWDKISRIVPHAVEPSDNEDIIKIRSETDFLNDYHPEAWDTSRTFGQFSRSLMDLIESDTFFNERYLRGDYKRGSYLTNFNNRRQFFAERLRYSGTYIHVEKLDERLKQYLLQKGVALPGENEWENWVKIDNDIGLLYMTYFAKSISLNRSLSIVTDLEESFSKSMYFESRLTSGYDDEPKFQLSNLLIQSVVPVDINAVPLDKIILIRKKYDEERSAYFAEISNLTRSISAAEDVNSIKEIIHQYSKQLTKEAKTLEKLYTLNKIETGSKFISVSAPSSILAASDHIPVELKPIAATAGIVCGLLSSVSSVRKNKLELQNNPMSYLLNLKSELSGNELLRRINDTIKGVRKW